MKEIEEARIHTTDAYILLYMNDDLDVIPGPTPTEETKESWKTDNEESSSMKRNVKMTDKMKEYQENQGKKVGKNQ